VKLGVKAPAGRGKRCTWGSKGEKLGEEDDAVWEGHRPYRACRFLGKERVKLRGSKWEKKEANKRGEKIESKGFEGRYRLEGATDSGNKESGKGVRERNFP